MQRSVKISLCVLGAVALAGCAPSYKPDTYATAAIQQVNKVEPGVVVGFRQVMITASGTVGAVTGGAAGGVLGSRSGTVGIDSALGTVGGSAIGSIVGTTLEHATADTTGWEYIVRKDNGEMVSVTQREETPLQLGQKVLVIGGAQARIVPDYSTPPAPAVAAKPAEEKPAEAPKAKSGNAKPSFPLLVVPLSSESTYTSAPEDTRTAPVAVPAAPAEPATPEVSPAAPDAPTAAIVETITEPAQQAAPAEATAAEPAPAEPAPEPETTPAAQP